MLDRLLRSEESRIDLQEAFACSDLKLNVAILVSGRRTAWPAQHSAISQW